MAVWKFVRTALRDPRAGQRVRLTAATQAKPSKGLFPWNLEDKGGAYHSLFVTPEGKIQYQRSEHSGTPFASLVTVTDGNSAHPRAIRDMTGRLFLTYEDRSGDTPNALLTHSGDHGATWEEPAVGIFGGKHPTIAVGQQGQVLIAAAVGTTIVAREMRESAEFSEPFTFQKWNGSALVDLQVADDTFHIQHELAPHGRFWLHLLESGASETSHYWSGDSGRTWTEGPTT